MKEPYMQFFVNDWKGDSGLRACSLAARGLWIELLGIMHESKAYGYLHVGCIPLIDVKEIALHVGSDPKIVAPLLKELADRGVYSVDMTGTIYSRRMVRSAEKRHKKSSAGKIGAENRWQPGVVCHDSANGKTHGKHDGKNDSKPHSKTDGKTMAHTGAIDRDQFQSYTDSLRSSAAAFGDWPSEIEGLKALAIVFLDAFGNCRESEAAKRHLPAYTGLLGAMRSRRGVTILDAWDACVQARSAQADKPLFGASVRLAMNYLPAPKAGFEGQNGPSNDAKTAAKTYLERNERAV